MGSMHVYIDLICTGLPVQVLPTYFVNRKRAEYKSRTKSSDPFDYILI